MSLMKTSGKKAENREPAFAGQFYPASKAALIRQLEELFEGAAKNEGLPKPRALISPHAGYIFSGHVAASAINQIPDGASYKRVFVLAPSHQFHFNGASAYESGNYSTPLGEIEVDTETSALLNKRSPVFHQNRQAHLPEHSLEVQLPFLQYKLKDSFRLVPIITGSNTAADCREIARALDPWFTPDNLFVVSTDFSHYPSYNDAIENDMDTANAICSNQPAELLRILKENEKKRINHLATSLCGWTSVLPLLYLTENKKVIYKKIDYKNSGDVAPYGDKERVVGYWALTVADQDEPFSLSEEEKRELLEKARKSITRYLETGKQGPPDPVENKGILEESAGAFVSIYVKGELRGCIGNFAREETLNDLVQRMAVMATVDRRFENLHADELDQMELEISVLSPLKKIQSTDEIELGKHGIYIKKGIRSGTFLPQVAKKTGWSKQEFLGHCARDKAGLGWEGWRDAELFTYEACIFRG